MLTNHIFCFQPQPTYFKTGSGLSTAGSNSRNLSASYKGMATSAKVLVYIYFPCSDELFKNYISENVKANTSELSFSDECVRWNNPEILRPFSLFGWFGITAYIP